jgi:hypothetical protein
VEAAQPKPPAPTDTVRPKSPIPVEAAQPKAPAPTDTVRPKSPIPAAVAQPKAPATVEAAQPKPPAATDTVRPKSPIPVEAAQPKAPAATDAVRPKSPIPAVAAQPKAPATVEAAQPKPPAATDAVRPKSPIPAVAAQPRAPTHTEVAKANSPPRIGNLTSVATGIRQVNQEKAVSSLGTIVQDIHAQTNNKYLTKVVDYHASPPIANLQTIMTELLQMSSGQSSARPQRPTHLPLAAEEQLSPSPILSDSVSISSNFAKELEQQLTMYKARTPSPVPKRAHEPAAMQSTLHQSQRIDKVSDLEIVKQGKGFKIGYVDRQGTDQRVILTKRIEAGPDIMARDPHVRLPYKGRKILNQLSSSVLYTNGHNSIQEDRKFQRLLDDIEVPIIGTNPQHFDEVSHLNHVLVIVDQQLLLNTNGIDTTHQRH